MTATNGPRRRRWRRTSALPLLMLAVFLLSSCKWIGSRQSGQTTAAPADTYAIALLTPVSGSLSGPGSRISAAVSQAVDEVNEQGGIAGRQIRLVIRDSKNEPSLAVEAVRGWSQDPSILAVIGDYAPAPSLAAGPVAEQGGLPMISSSVVNPQFAALSTWTFTVMPRPEKAAVYLADRYLARQHPNARIGVLYVNSVWGRQVYESWQKQAEASRLTVVATEIYAEEDKDWRVAINRCRQAGADWMVLIDPSRVPELARQIRAASWGVSLAAIGPGEKLDLGGQAARDLEGMVLPLHYVADPEERTSRYFIERYRKKNGANPDIDAAAAYDAARMVMTAIYGLTADGTEPTRAAIRETLAQLSYSGLTGPISFDANGEAVARYRMAQVRQGEFVALEPVETMP